MGDDHGERVDDHEATDEERDQRERLQRTLEDAADRAGRSGPILHEIVAGLHDHAGRDERFDRGDEVVLAALAAHIDVVVLTLPRVEPDEGVVVDHRDGAAVVLGCVLAELGDADDRDLLRTGQGEQGDRLSDGQVLVVDRGTVDDDLTGRCRRGPLDDVGVVEFVVVDPGAARCVVGERGAVVGKERDRAGQVAGDGGNLGQRGDVVSDVSRDAVPSRELRAGRLGVLVGDDGGVHAAVLIASVALESVGDAIGHEAGGCEEGNTGHDRHQGGDVPADVHLDAAEGEREHVRLRNASSGRAPDRWSVRPSRR